MHTVSGGCHCENILLHLELARAPASYSPRACDCSFCRKHQAAYVSDPQGALRIRLADPGKAGRYRQGSGQAEMLFCTTCGVLLGALYQGAARAYATVNARVIDPAVRFGAESVVSPQTLAASAKATRWQELWFANVSIGTPDG